jgi:PAS domain S-box-containing protein
MSVDTLAAREHLQTNYEAHYELLPYGVLVHAGGSWIYANAEARAMFGDVVGRSILGIVPPDMREIVGGRVKVVMSGKRTETIEQRLIGAGGRELYADVVGVPSVTPDGRPAALVIARDVSARHALERRYRATFEQAAVGMCHVALQGELIRVNDRFCQLLGYSRDELEGLHIRDVMHPLDIDTGTERIAELVAGDLSSYSTERRYMRKDGTVVWTILTVSLVRKADRTPDYFITVIEDISRRKSAEAEVEASEKRFRHLVENGADLILVIDRDATITFASRNSVNVLGFPPAEMIGRNVFEFDHPDDFPAASAVFKDVIDSGRRGLTTLRVKHKSGGWRVLDVSAVNLLDDPSVAGLVINAHDVTERDRLGAEVEQLKRVESLGRVAASVAHELNNVLMSFQTVAMRAERSGLDPELQATLKRALLRGKSVTSDILRFTQPAVASKERVSLAEWLAESVKDAEPLLGKTHSVRLVLDEQLGYVSIDRQQLGQVLTNLVANARDAMPGGGTIDIAGRHSDHDHGEVSFTASDRGTGIADELRERIFEPLFTTKSSGTGLGLAIVHQIVLRHGGRITVESEPGVGTTFTVTLPRLSS